MTQTDGGIRVDPPTEDGITLDASVPHLLTLIVGTRRHFIRATVARPQVQRLRDELTRWLHEDDADP